MHVSINIIFCGLYIMVWCTCIDCTYCAEYSVKLIFVFCLFYLCALICSDAYKSIRSYVYCDTFSGSITYSCLGRQKVKFCTYSPQWPHRTYITAAPPPFYSYLTIFRTHPSSHKLSTLSKHQLHLSESSWWFDKVGKAECVVVTNLVEG